MLVQACEHLLSIMLYKLYLKKKNLCFPKFLVLGQLPSDKYFVSLQVNTIVLVVVIDC